MLCGSERSAAAAAAAAARSGRFEGDSVQKLADWQAPFEACLRGVAADTAPLPELIQMVPDINNHMRAAKSRFSCAQTESLRTTGPPKGHCTIEACI
jgi:hypothetical protein